jgi:hypothetical protein
MTHHKSKEHQGKQMKILVVTVFLLLSGCSWNWLPLINLTKEVCPRGTDPISKECR